MLLWGNLKRKNLTKLNHSRTVWDLNRQLMWWTRSEKMTKRKGSKAKVDRLLICLKTFGKSDWSDSFEFVHPCLASQHQSIAWKRISRSGGTWQSKFCFLEALANHSFFRFFVSFDQFVCFFNAHLFFDQFFLWRWQVSQTTLLLKFSFVLFFFASLWDK